MALPVDTHVALALGAALLFGFGPILSKHGLSADGTWLGNVLTVVGVRVALFWVVLLATAGPAFLIDVTPVAVLLFAVASAAASGLGRMAFYVGVGRVGSSLSNAGANVRPLFAVVLASVWLGETVTLRAAVGVCLLVVGLVAISLSRGGDIEGWRRRELLYPLGAAFGYALGNVVRRYGFTVTDLSTLQALAFGETASLLTIAAYAVATGRLGDLRTGRRTHALFAGNGLVAGVGLFLLFAALRRGPVAVVDPLIATAPLFTVGFAAVFLRELERVTLGVAVGSLLIVAGAALVP
ncbi:MAG: EamA family transporter [Haloferacaceae archaeon]